MENLDLLKSQIHSSCRLALPEGLKDLMWDISREVLRAQPQNFCAFIADYLSVLLVARENLHVAAHVCTDICDDICHTLLEDELRNHGFPEDVALEAKNVIQKCFEKNEVNEAKIIIELLKLADIEEQHLPAIQNAIRTAFLRHQANRNIIYESSSSDEDDDVTRAARHTLRLFRQTKPTVQEMNKAAVTVQAAYRAYGVRRKPGPEKKYRFKSDTSPKKPKPKLISFNEELCNSVTAAFSEAESIADNASEKTDDIYVSEPKNVLHTASSISLAGSYLQLPKYKPYCAYDPDIIPELDEIAEREHTMVDYTLEPDKLAKPKKKISFHELRREINIDDESEESIEELEYDEAFEEAECYGEELPNYRNNQIADVFIEESIINEKINNSSDFSNVDSDEEVHGVEISENDELKEELLTKITDNKEVFDETYIVEETDTNKDATYNLEVDDIKYIDELIEDDEYLDLAVKHVNSVEDAIVDNKDIVSEENASVIKEVIHQIDDMVEVNKALYE